MLDLANLSVCFIAGTLGQGGAERQLFYIAKSLQESGTKVRILSLTKGEFWEDEIRSLGVSITWVGQRSSKVGRLSRIVSELRKDPPDIIQSQHFYTNLYAVTAARMLKLQEIGAIRNDAKSEFRAHSPWISRLSLRWPRIIAANSQAGVRNAVALGVSKERLSFLPNAVDCDRVKPVHKNNSKKVQIITVGRLVKQKRIDRFLSVLNQLKRISRVEVKASIVGEGSLRSDLEDQAAQMGLLPGIVEFTGAVADITPIYEKADILLLTSDYEGTPNVVLEAMAAGLPVIATRVGGVPDIIRNGETGFLVDVRDESSMVELLINLISDRELRLRIGYSARKYVEDYHSLNRLPGMLAKVYEAALS